MRNVTAVLGLCSSLTLPLLLPQAGHCWNNTGHETVAQIALATLSVTHPAVAARVRDVIAHQPQDGFRDFVVASTYPDMYVRSHDPSKADWHYINLPYDPVTGSIGDRGVAGRAVDKVQELRDALHNGVGTPAEQAENLSWLIHLVGDLHQPLHAVALFGAEHPQGDHGGNFFPIGTVVIRGQKPAKKLHQLWDDALNLQPFDSVETLASGIMTQYPQLGFGGKVGVLDPMRWAAESAETARDSVYNYQGRAIKMDRRLSRFYLSNTNALARERVALGGYHLAALLVQIYDTNP